MGYRSSTAAGLAMAAAGAQAAMMAVDGVLTVDDYEAFNAGAYGTLPNVSYHSANLSSPLFQVSTWDKSRVDPTPYMIWGPSIATSGANPSIFSTSDLSLVWQGTEYESANNVRVQTYRGEQYITFSDRQNCLMLDNSYQLAYNLTTTVPGQVVDMHECEITADDTAIFTIYQDIPYDLTPVDGPANGTLTDSLFEEIDIETGERLFLWRASDHVNITEMDGSYTEGYGGMMSASPSTAAHKRRQAEEDNGPLDYFHINSIEKVVPSGNYLISGRRCKLLIYVDPSGDKIWQLGGDENSFEDLSPSDAPATSIGYQHHARFVPGTDLREVVLFDNYQVGTSDTVGCAANCSRGLHVSLDYERMTAQTLAQFWHPRSMQVFAMGGFEYQEATGNGLVGWGANPAITEHAPGGEVVWDIQIAPWSEEGGGGAPPGGNVSSTGLGSLGKRQGGGAPPGDGGGQFVQGSSVYRVFKTEWKGAPLTVPAIAMAADGGSGDDESDFYVSWNGATEVVSWAVFGGNSTTTGGGVGAMRPVAGVAPFEKTGFETKVGTGDAACLYVQVAGMAASGEELGRSGIMELSTGEMVDV